ncbi:MAG TPA: trigger factor, partial [Anaerolineales bacterium]|nr:trigger factor [Anaerolineales bacterium]
MNIQTERNEKHQAILTVDLEPSQIEGKKQQAAKKLAKTTHIPGFRPGKAPYHMILRHIGEGRILEEAIEALIDEIYPKMLDESGVNPYGPGKVEKINLETEPPSVQFSVPLAPEVTLGEYKSVRLQYEKPELTDENVTKAIQGMREMYAEVTKVDRHAEETDLVNIVLTGKIAGSEDETLYIDHESYPVIIEPETADTAHEWPFPGFSRHLIGTSAGDTKSLSYTYPEDYEDDEAEEKSVSVQGKTVDFEIEVSKVSSRLVPEVDEAFIKKMGPYETIEEFEADTRKQLSERNSSSYDEDYDEHLLEELLKDTVVHYPEEALN